MSLIQVYAPTSESTDEEIDEFYDQLQMTINQTNKKDLMVIMGDFNAKVWSDHTNWERLIEGLTESFC